jgi:hypothetical protein
VADPGRGVGSFLRQGCLYIPSEAELAPLPDELDSEWKLFDLRVDAGETRDVKEDEPEVLARMQQALRVYSR